MKLIQTYEIDNFDNLEFISRHSMDGKFTFVDQRVSQLLGYSPSELLGKSCFEFFHPEDQPLMKENFEEGKTYYEFFKFSLVALIFVFVILILI